MSTDGSRAPAPSLPVQGSPVQGSPAHGSSVHGSSVHGPRRGLGGRAPVWFTVVWFTLGCLASLQTLVYMANRGDLRAWIAFVLVLVAQGAMAWACTDAVNKLRAGRPSHHRRNRACLVVATIATFALLAVLFREGFGEEPLLGLEFTLVLVLPWRWGLGLALLIPVPAAFILAPVMQGQTAAYTASMFVFIGLGAALRYFLVSAAQLSASQAEAAELRLSEERNRMARDLHDILGHTLTVITLKSDLANRLVDVDSEAVRRELGEIQSLTRSALADVRATVNNYRDMSLAGEIARASAALSAAGITADLPHSIDDVDPELRELFAWCLREGVTNVVRHSGARRCVVRLTACSLSIADDGVGMVGAGDGNGLDGLRQRALGFDCDLRFGPGLSGAGLELLVGRLPPADPSTQEDR